MQKTLVKGSARAHKTRVQTFRVSLKNGVDSEGIWGYMLEPACIMSLRDTSGRGRGEKGECSCYYCLTFHTRDEVLVGTGV